MHVNWCTELSYLRLAREYSIFGRVVFEIERKEVVCIQWLYRVGLLSSLVVLRSNVSTFPSVQYSSDVSGLYLRELLKVTLPKDYEATNKYDSVRTFQFPNVQNSRHCSK